MNIYEYLNVLSYVIRKNKELEQKYNNAGN